MRYIFSLFSTENNIYTSFLGNILRDISRKTYKAKYPAQLQSLRSIDINAAEQAILEIIHVYKPTATYVMEDESVQKCVDAQGKTLLLVKRMHLDIDDKEAKTTTHRTWLQLEFDIALVHRCITQIINMVYSRELLLFDWQNPDIPIWGMHELVYEAPLILHQRSCQLKAKIQNGIKGVRNIFTLMDRDWPPTNAAQNLYDCNAAYAIVLNRRGNDRRSLGDCAGELIKILEANLANEKLTFKDRAFWIDGKEYSICFTLEGWNGNPSITAHANSNGVPIIEPLRRPCAAKMLRTLREFPRNPSEYTDTIHRLHTLEFINRFPNPAERLAASIRVGKQLQKMDLDVHASMPRTHSGCYIGLYDYECSNRGASHSETLYLCEEAFSFLMPSFNKYYPGGLNYYSLTNIVNQHICKDVIQDLKHIAWLIAHTPDDPKLAPYIKFFSLYALGGPTEYNCGEVDETYRKNYLYNHRKQLILFYNFMIDWLERNITGDFDRRLNIEGL